MVVWDSDGALFVPVQQALTAVKAVFVATPAPGRRNALQLSQSTRGRLESTPHGTFANSVCDRIVVRRLRFFQRIHTMAVPAASVDLDEKGRPRSLDAPTPPPDSTEEQKAVDGGGEVTVVPEATTAGSTHVSSAVTPDTEVVNVDDVLELVEGVAREQVAECTVQLRSLYKSFDANDNGQLELSEFTPLIQSVCSRLGSTVTAPTRYDIARMYVMRCCLVEDIVCLMLWVTKV